MLDISKRSLNLEDIRQQLHRLAYLSQYTSAMKSIVRQHGVSVIAQNCDDGYSIWNPEYSDEAIQYLEHTELDLDSIYISEIDASIIERVRPTYRAYGLRNLYAIPLDQTLALMPNDGISAGHFDFMGEFNSSSTCTVNVIQRLKHKLSDRACFAFTHCDNFRNDTIGNMKYGLALWEYFSNTFPAIGEYKELFQIELVDKTLPKSINNILWFNPSTLTWAATVLIHHRQYQVNIVESLKYRQNPSRGNTYMNKCIISLTRADFDFDTSLKSLIGNPTRTLN